MRLFLSMALLLCLCSGLNSAQDNLAYKQYLTDDNSEVQNTACQLGNPCGCTCPSTCHTFWGRVDGMLWWTKGSKLPPLITTCLDGTEQSEVGVLGRPVYGDQHVNQDARSGFRVSGGFWLDDCQMIGIGADYFDLGSISDHGEGTGDGTPILARPFFDVETGQPAAELVSYPGVMSGTVSVDSRDYFQSAGTWFRLNLVNCRCVDDCSCSHTCSDCRRGHWGYGIDLLMGYRYYRTSDALTIREDLEDISTEPSAGTTFGITDDFRTENRFHGGEIGFRTRVDRGCWSLGLLTKVAIGNNRYGVTIDGNTTTTIPGFPPTIDANGILATQSNIGRYEDDQFTIIPQIGFELGYQICDNLDLFVGYNLIYWPHVQRAAEQIDLNVDPRNWPPVQEGALPLPAPKLCSTDFWAQGINFGVGCRY